MLEGRENDGPLAGLDEMKLQPFLRCQEKRLGYFSEIAAPN